MVRLGIPQQKINELKVAPLSPEIESCIEKLLGWKQVDKEMKNFEIQLNHVEAEVEKVQSSGSRSNIDQLAKFDFKGKIDDLGEKFQKDTRQWFFDELSTLFADEESRVMILTADSGIEKSVLSAKVCED